MFTDGTTTYSCDTLVAGLILQSTPVDWWGLYWIHRDTDPSIYTSLQIINQHPWLSENYDEEWLIPALLHTTLQKKSQGNTLTLQTDKIQIEYISHFILCLHTHED